MNSGIHPLLLPKTQCAYAFNLTFRGDLISQRPGWRKINLSFNSAGDQTSFQKNLFQGASYFKPDSGTEALRCVISGKFFHIIPDTLGNATVQQIALPAAMDPLAPQVWLWQSEKWTIFQDGSSRPMFVDDSNVATQSNWSTPQNFSTTVSAGAVIKAVGDPAATTLTLASTANLVVGDIVTFGGGYGQMAVQVVAGTDFVNLSAPAGKFMPVGTVATWTHFGTQLPPGRMGVYGLGRNWICLVDGKQFVASDIVGGSSGTVANNFRDSVLNITENNYLVGGGNFAVPGSVGDIRSMIFQSVLDKSLGQGALEIFTPNNVFTCQAPVDRTTWTSITNPILTESLINSGGLGQNSTIQVNTDTFSRATDGIRAISVSTHYFSQDWGNPPISREMSRLLNQDDVSLLQYGSAVVFDNRMLMTASPQASTQGVYHQALVAMNLDPVSSLRGKQPSIYDGTWTGPNILQILRGYFSAVDRCFAFTLNVITNTIELWELLPSSTTQVGDDVGGGQLIPIVSYFESPVLFNNIKGKTQFDLCRLTDGEMQIDKLIGRVDFTVYYKPDQYPCWVLWRSCSVCAEQEDIGDSNMPGDPSTANDKPGFQHRIGLGQPPASDCDTYTGQVMREAKTFQVKIVMQGQCEFIGFKAKAISVPEPKWAPVADFCQPFCGDILPSGIVAS